MKWLKMIAVALSIMFLTGCGTPKATIEIHPLNDGGAIVHIEGRANATIKTPSGLEGSMDTMGQGSLLGILNMDWLNDDFYDKIWEYMTLKGIFGL